MSAIPEPKLSAEDYLAGERLAEAKHEYLNGEGYVMAGASEAHNLIVGNMMFELRSRLKGDRCRVYPSDMRLKVAETGLFTYPDVIVVCSNPLFVDDRRDTLLNPTVIFEVLSESTEANDRGWKWVHYRQLASLAEYVMISQAECRIEQFVRQPEGTWLFRDYQSLDACLRLPTLSLEIPMSDIYYLVEMDV